MAYSKYKNWARDRNIKPIPNTMPLLLKIINGNYEYSYIFDVAAELNESADTAINLAYKNYRGTDQLSRSEAAREVGRKKRLKAVKVKIDAGLDELIILDKLRFALNQEFGNDYWDAIFGTDFDGTVLDLYYKYKEMSALSITPSEFDIKYKRNGCAKYLYLLEEVEYEPR